MEHVEHDDDFLDPDLAEEPDDVTEPPEDDGIEGEEHLGLTPPD